MCTRNLTRARDDRELASLRSDGAWILRACTPRIRRRLGSRIILVWRIAYEDGSGRILESVLLPLAIEGAPVPRNRRSRQLLIAALEGATCERTEAAIAIWREAADGALQALTAARMAREQAISTSIQRRDLASYQPGLFDRRAERQQSGAAAAARNIDQGLAERFESARHFATARRRTSQLMLAVAP